MKQTTSGAAMTDLETIDVEATDHGSVEEFKCRSLIWFSSTAASTRATAGI